MGRLAMLLTRTSFLGLPRITLRRMMIYVAVFAVAPKAIIELLPYMNSASNHWAVCHREAAQDSELASGYRNLAKRHPGDAIVAPNVFYSGDDPEHETPLTGAEAARMAEYLDARRQVYEHAKWRPWAGVPNPPWAKSNRHLYKHASRGSRFFFEPTPTMIQNWLSIESDSSNTTK
jgi:hypothetical protein